uniref:Uncharacterized protein n=1 Tax=Chlamydomonas leiostraca TaxID=1034604 RepID=A0A7S0RWE3_9CHLO
MLRAHVTWTLQPPPPGLWHAPSGATCHPAAPLTTKNEVAEVAYKKRAKELGSHIPAAYAMHCTKSPALNSCSASKACLPGSPSSSCAWLAPSYCSADCCHSTDAIMRSLSRSLPPASWPCVPATRAAPGAPTGTSASAAAARTIAW